MHDFYDENNNLKPLRASVSSTAILKAKAPLKVGIPIIGNNLQRSHTSVGLRPEPAPKPISLYNQNNNNSFLSNGFSPANNTRKVILPSYDIDLSSEKSEEQQTSPIVVVNESMPTSDSLNVKRLSMSQQDLFRPERPQRNYRLRQISNETPMFSVLVINVFSHAGVENNRCINFSSC